MPARIARPAPRLHGMNRPKTGRGNAPRWGDMGVKSRVSGGVPARREAVPGKDDPFSKGRLYAMRALLFACTALVPPALVLPAFAQTQGTDAQNGGAGVYDLSSSVPGVGGSGGSAGIGGGTAASGGTGGSNGIGAPSGTIEAGYGPAGGAHGAVGAGDPGGRGGGSDSGGGGGGYSNSGSGGGGGGAGGVGLELIGTADNSGTIGGGRGGGGGLGGISPTAMPGAGVVAGAGGGGGGGSAIIATGTSLTNSGTITGGAGGDGAPAGGVGPDAGARFGSSTGGSGGNGITVSTKTGFSITNTGTISGGLGGMHGYAADGRQAGGIGIVGESLTIESSGTIAGGGTSAAIRFTGGSNSLTISGGAVGDVEADGQTSITLTAGTIGALRLNGGTTMLSGHFGSTISGSGGLAKLGSDVLTLGGNNTFSGGTTIYGGTIRAESSTAFGTGTITTLGSVIDYAAGVDIANTIILDSDHTQLQVLTGTATQSGPVLETAGTPRPLEKTGAGTLIVMSLANSGLTTVSAGTLQAGTASAFSMNSIYQVAAGATLDLGGEYQLVGGISGSGTITNSGKSDALLVVGVVGTTTASTTFSGVIKDGSQQLSLEVATSGTLTLTGANTYTGVTIICDCATLQIGNGGTTGSITSDVVNNGTLIFNRSNTYRFDHLIEDGIGSSGKVVQAGTGTTIFSADQAYTGGTVINAGTLQVGVGGTTGSVRGIVTINAGGAFAVDRSDLYYLPNVLTGAGRFIQRGSGTTILGDFVSYTGGTVIEAGTLQVGSGGSEGKLGTGAIVNNGALVIDRRGTVTIADAMTGSGSFKTTGGTDGTGTIVVTGAFGHRGGTTIAAGTLQIGNGGATGSLAGDVANAGRLVFNRSGTTEADGAMSGTGSLELLGGGTLILTGAVNHGGGTAITAGTLQIGKGGTTGSIGGNIDNAGTLAFNRADTLVVEGVISGTGHISQIGPGRTVLSGNSSGFAGTTTVEAGTLAVNGTLGGPVTVASGGALGGTGTVGATTVGAGGALAPGNSIGSLTIAGSLSFAAGSFYRVEVSPAAADRVNVTGSAMLAGTVSARFAPGTYVARHYTILSAAGGVSGSFGSIVETDLPRGFRTSLSYDAGNAYLNLDIALPDYDGLNRNQRNVANAIAASFHTTGGIPLVFGTLTPAGLSATAGEVATATQQAAYNGSSLFLNLMLDPMAGARGAGASAPASSLIDMADLPAGRSPAGRVSAGWSVWTKAFAQAGRTASDQGLGAAGTSGSIFGVAVGAEKRLSPDIVAGFALAGGGASISARGTGSGDFFQIGLYGSARIGEGYLSAAAAYGWHRFDISRSLAIGSANDTYVSAPVAHSFGGRLEAGRRFGSRSLALTPYAALEAIGYSAAGYAESFAAPASGIFALRYAAKSTATLRSEVGLRFDSLVPLGTGVDLLTFGRLGYSHQAATQRALDAAFQSLLNSGFTVFGARASTHTALASLGAEARFAGGARISATLDGELGDRHRTIRAQLGLRHEW